MITEVKIKNIGDIHELSKDICSHLIHLTPEQRPIVVRWGTEDDMKSKEKS